MSVQFEGGSDGAAGAVPPPDMRRKSRDFRAGWKAAIAWAKSIGHWKHLPRGDPQKGRAVRLAQEQKGQRDDA